MTFSNDSYKNVPVDLIKSGESNPAGMMIFSRSLSSGASLNLSPAAQWRIYFESSVTFLFHVDEIEKIEAPSASANYLISVIMKSNLFL